MSLTTNIVAYYTMQGNGNDSTGSYNLIDSSISYSNSYGKIGQGASFNGSSSNQQTSGDVAALDSASALSISYWAYFNSVSGSQTHVSKWYYGIGGQFACYSIGTTLYFFIIGSLADGGSNCVLASTTLATGQWYHIVMVFDGTLTGNTNRAKIYVNGSNVTSSSIGTIQSSTLSYSTFLNTGYLHGSGSFYNGYLDEVGVWSRALTSSEVTQLYNSGSGLQYPFTGNGNSNFFIFLQ